MEGNINNNRGTRLRRSFRRILGKKGMASSCFSLVVVVDDVVVVVDDDVAGPLLFRRIVGLP